MTLKTPILRDKKYTDSFKIPGKHRCLITGAEMPDGAHIRHGFYGMGIKPGDDLIIPLAHRLHAEQHQVGEERFWDDMWWQLSANQMWDKFQILWEKEDRTIDETMDYVKQIARDYYANWKVSK